MIVPAAGVIEAPRSKLRGIFDRRDFLSIFDSLANPAAELRGMRSLFRFKHIIDRPE
jgi:hypothetical protein